MRNACFAAVSIALLACSSSDRDAPFAGPDASSSLGHDPSADEAGVPWEAGSTEDAKVPEQPSDASHDAHAGDYATRELATPPSYRGSVNNGAACDTDYPTIGFEPMAGASVRHPLFLYFVGTAFDRADPSAQYDNVAATTVAEAMARRGFVALSVSYDNGALAWLSDHLNQLHCLFEGADGLLARACALPQVDCSLGIATWGHSQGGLVAMMAADYDARVRGAWATGYGGEKRVTLSKHRIRVVNGENDTSNGTASVLNGITGLSPEMCPDPDQCLRDDGSGWVIVRQADLADPAASTADHCWFDRRSCGGSERSLEPTWVDASSTRAYALEPNADWLATTARRTDLP